MKNKVYAKLPKHQITKYIVMFVQLTLSRHWCSRGRAQQQEDLRLPLCSFEKACRAQRPAPMTTNCTPGFFRRTCDTLRHLQSLWSRWNIPMRVLKICCQKQVRHKPDNVLNIHGTNLALAVDIALIGLRDVHHLLILSFSILYEYRLMEGIPKTMYLP